MIKISPHIFSLFILSLPLKTFAVPMTMSEGITLLSQPNPAQPRVSCPAETSPFCQDLAEISCAPQPQLRADPTGTTSSNGIGSDLASYIQSVKTQLVPAVSGLKLKQNPALKQKMVGLFKKNLTDQGLENCVVDLLLFENLKIFEYSPKESKDRLKDPAGNCEMKSKHDDENFEATKDAIVSSLESEKSFHGLKSKLAQENALLAQTHPSVVRSQDLFKKTKIASLAVLKKSVRDPAMLKIITDRVEALTFSVDGQLARSANYDFQNNSVTVTLGRLLECSSEFCMVRYLAHEIGHAFDPCNFSKLKGLDITTVGIEQALSHHPLKSGIECMVDELAIDRSINADSICDNRQICEGFPDLFASEVLPEFMKTHHAAFGPEEFQRGYANATMCYSQSAVQNRSAHERPAKAAVAKFLMNVPSIRQQMGCQETKTSNTCGLNGRE